VDVVASPNAKADLNKPLIILNPAAQEGKAPKLFLRIRNQVDALGAVVVESTGCFDQDTAIVSDALARGCTLVVAAGGDGTVHSVVNALWRIGAGSIPRGVCFGAIGLGSSNDFHKPYDTDVPVLLHSETAAPRDLVLSHYGIHGNPRERVCAVSASIGATAQANEFFNDGRGVIRRLKHGESNAAIAYAALRTIARYDNFPATVELPAGNFESRISNLSILKTPFLSGSLRFDIPIKPDDGLLAVALCENMSRLRLGAALLALYRGHFRGRPGTRYWQVERVGFKTARPVALEMDGEVTRVDSASFEIQPGALLTCGR
jgi:diacylglycerol kinase (ATP)